VTLSPARIAYHEAGHAVACLASGVKFDHLTSVRDPSGDFAGCIRIAPGQPAANDGEYVWVASSGIIADRLKRGRGDFTANTIRNWHSYGWLEPDIRMLIGEFPDRGQLLALVMYSAKMTQAFWPAVEAIARPLLTPSVLNQDEAQELFLAAIPKASS
jgi:hypothetical protein